MQDCHISNVLAMEILQSGTKPLIYDGKISVMRFIVRVLQLNQNLTSISAAVLSRCLTNCKIIQTLKQNLLAWNFVTSYDKTKHQMMNCSKDLTLPLINGGRLKHRYEVLHPRALKFSLLNKKTFILWVRYFVWKFHTNILLIL